MQKNNKKIEIVMKILSVKYIEDYKLEVRFSNQEQRIVDFEKFIKSSKNASINKFSDKNLFKQVVIDTGFLSWNQGEMEISASSVHKKFSKSTILFADENK